MSKPIVRIHNIETDEVVDREMTDAEFKQYELDQLKFEEQLKAENAKAMAKAAAEAKLVALGLDLDDLRALGL